MKRGGRATRAGASVVALALAVTLAACTSENDGLVDQYRSGSNQGFIAGDVAPAAAVEPTAARGATAPPRKPRYPGTSGSTHGERNETRPASIAIGIASHSAPSNTTAPGFTGSPRARRARSS